MEIQQRTVDPAITVIAIDGRIALGADGMAVKNAIDELIEAGQSKLVLDMAQVSYMDSAGLGIIVSSMSNATAAGGEFRLAATPETVRQVLKVTNVLALLKLNDTVDEAVAAMQD